MFNESSQLVKVWVRLVRSGSFERSQVPTLSNLRNVVWAVLDTEGRV